MRRVILRVGIKPAAPVPTEHLTKAPITSWCRECVFWAGNLETGPIGMCQRRRASGRIETGFADTCSLFSTKAGKYWGWATVRVTPGGYAILNRNGVVVSELPGPYSKASDRRDRINESYRMDRGI